MNDNNFSYDYFEQTLAPSKKKKRPSYFIVIIIALICSLVGGMITYGVLKSSGHIDNNILETATTSPADTSTAKPYTTLSGTYSPNATAPPIDPANPVVDLVDKVGDSVVAVYQIEKTNGKETITTGGSGFIISEDGIIVTNNHVIANADQLRVVLSNGKKYDASVVGADAREDIAVLKIIPDEKLTCAAFGQSSSLRKGEYVVAIGNPLGQEGTVTLGVVGAVNRKVVSEGNSFTMIQHDAAINPGNSGGPLFNLKGEVIGMNTMKEIQTYDEYGNTISTEGLGYAIPIDIVKPIVDELSTKGKVNRAALGITCQDSANGVVIATIVIGGAADDADLKTGDIITKFENKDIALVSDLVGELKQCVVGQKVTLTIVRQGNTMTVPVTLKASQ